MSHSIETDLVETGALPDYSNCEDIVLGLLVVDTFGDTNSSNLNMTHSLMSRQMSGNVLPVELLWSGVPHIPPC